MRCCSIHLVKKMYQVPADMITRVIRMEREIQPPFSHMCCRPYGVDWSAAFTLAAALPAAGAASGAGAAAGAASGAAGAAAGAAGAAAWARTGATALRLVMATMAAAIVSFLKFSFLLR